MDNSTFSIIIPTYFSSSIEGTISSIYRQTFQNNILEVLIVGQQNDLLIQDNSKFRYIQIEKNPSPARNRNTGALLARSEWLCFLDSDCVLMNDWLEKIVKNLNKTDKIYVGSIDMYPEMPYWSWCDHLLCFGDQVHGIYNGKFLRYVATNNMVVSKDLFLRIGGFDESFTKPAGEDFDFCTQAAKLGHRIVFINDAIVFHNHIRKNSNNAWMHLFLFGESTIQRRLKNKNELSIFHKWEYSILKNKYMGEIFGLGRILFRAILRPIYRPYFIKYWRYLPGILILDIAHTKGMINYLRNNNKDFIN